MNEDNSEDVSLSQILLVLKPQGLGYLDKFD